MVKDPKFARFYLLPKIHKRLENVPGRPVISNCGFYTENISAFLDFHLQLQTREVKSYIKDTYNFLRNSIPWQTFVSIKQNLFHEHYCSDGHVGIANWCITLIDQVENKKKFRKKELYWINKLNTSAPVGLNVRCTKHTKYECFVKHFWQIHRKDENVLNLYVLLFFIYLRYYYCY